MPRKRPIEDDYTEVLCPDCNEPVYQLVHLTIKCPLGWKNLSKLGLRSHFVEIKGANWDAATWYCSCGQRTPTKTKVKMTRPNLLKHISIPGNPRNRPVEPTHDDE